MNWRSCLTAYLLILLTTSFAVAQSAGAPSNPQEPKESGLSANDGVEPRAVPAGVESDRRRLLYETETGGLIPIQEILGTSDSEILEELLLRIQQQDVPRFEFARMELTGIIDGDILKLTAEIQIRIRRPGEWVTVPLSFGDLHLTDGYRHSSDAADAREIPETADSTQKKWHLYGAGLHTLTLQLIGRTRPLQPVGHSLNLTLPACTIEHARFHFQTPVELQELPADSVAETDQAEGGKGIQEVKIWGLASEFTMSWQEVVPKISQSPLIVAQSRMKLQLATIPVALSVTQKLEITGSAVSELQVTIPPGFRRLETRARNSTGTIPLNTSDSSEVPADNGANAGSTAMLRFSSPVEGAVTLEYDLELINRSFPQDIRILIPVIREAASQSGDLDIGVPPGLLVQPTLQEGARQRRVTSETDLNIAAVAYLLSSAKSEVTLKVEEFEAQYAVSPEVEFQPDDENLLMTARFSVNVLRGSLLDMQIVWPGYTGGPWQILPGPVLMVTDKTSTPLIVEQSGDTFQLTFPDRQSGQFRLELKAFASQTAIRAEGVRTVCPEIRSRTRQQLVITTVESDKYSIQPVSADTLQPLPAVPAQNLTVSGTPVDNRRVQTWLHDPPEKPLRFDLIEQAPSVTASMQAGLTPQADGIRVHQEMTFLIEHSDLTTLSLSVPEGILPEVKIQDEPESLRPAIDSATRISLRLSRPRRGKLTLLLDYIWPIAESKQPSAGQTADYDVPLIQPQLSELRHCEAGTSTSSGLSVISSGGWKPVYSDKFESAWLADSVTSTVPLRWEKSSLLNSEEKPVFLVRRTMLYMNESVTGTTAFFERRPARFIFRLPRNISADARVVVTIDGIPVRAENGDRLELQDLADGTQWTLTSSRPATSADRPVILEVQVRERAIRRSSLWQRLSFTRPQFDSGFTSVPGIWLVETTEDTQVVSTDPTQSIVASVPYVPFLRRMISSDAVESGSNDDQVSAILSPYSSDVQREIRERIDGRKFPSGSERLFYFSADSDPLVLHVVTRVSLLLVSAVSCVVFFAVMCLINVRSAGLPLLLAVPALPVVYLLQPEWTLLLAPYVAVGLIFGIVTFTFQRLTGDRRTRFPGSGRSGDMLTVFGVSGFLKANSHTGRSDVVVREGSELSASASR